MLNRLIDFSLRNRALVLVLTAGLAVAGGVAVTRLSFDAFPDTTDVMVQVNTGAPGLSPVEVEQLITIKVEQAMGGLPRLKLLRSISKFGLSQVTVVFDDGTDLYFARAQVLERLQRIELPQGTRRPTMGPIATGLGEIYHYLVTAPRGDVTHARTIQDWVIKPQLLAAGGVAEVNSWGGFEKRFEVSVDPARLAKHRVTLWDVIESLKASNLNVGGGIVETSGEILLVHGVGLTETAEEIGGIVIHTVDGRAVRVRDVATVAEGAEQRRGVVTAQGNEESVLGLGFLLMGENSDKVAERLKRKMAEAKKILPKGTRIEEVYDRTELVDKVIHTVWKNLFEGALLVIAVLFLFLGRFRAACIVALAIPLSMLFAFNLMLRTGIAGTLMSLGAIDFGLVVDSSIILVENSVRRLQEDTTGRPVVEIVREASKEVRRPTMFGELIIMIVYVPVLALHGVEGKMFRPMALTVLFALGGSLLFSLTLMPVLASLFLKRGAAGRGEPRLIRWLKALYRPVLAWAVRRRWLVLGSAVIIVAGTVPVALRLGAVFVPKLDEGSVVINTVRLPGVSVTESARFSTEIERLLLAEFPDEIDRVWTRTGSPEVATDPMGIEVSDVFITLRPRDRWKRAKTKAELEERMRGVLLPLPGMNFSFTQPIEMRFNEMIAGVRTDLGVKIYGGDLDRLRDLAERVRSILAGIPGAENPFVEPMVGQPVLQVKLRSESLSRYGVRARDVLDFVEAIGGKQVSEVREGDKRFAMALRMPDRYARNPDLVESLLVTTPAGQRIPLSKLATVRRVSGPMVVTREWNRRRAVVTCNVKGRDLAGFVKAARERIDREMGPELEKLGYGIGFGGQFENLERATKTLALVVPAALVLILLLVYATFRSGIDLVCVLTGVPFAVVGGVWALSLRGMPFSVSAGVGFIALGGVSVLAALVMVSMFRGLLREGLAPREAVLRAAELRLRPVLMTALVAGLGFLPMALNTDVGAEVQRPLATVVIGGLVSSTLLTLFVLPTLYAWVGAGRKIRDER